VGTRTDTPRRNEKEEESGRRARGGRWRGCTIRSRLSRPVSCILVFFYICKKYES